MSAEILTPEAVARLYARGRAILTGTYTLTTRTAMYDFDTTAQIYERTDAGLRVQHSIGARWDGTRFVRCRCDFCLRCRPREWAEVAP